MAERIDLLVRAALHALAVLFPSGRVTIIESVGPDAAHPYEVVNVDVTDRPEQREQLAEAIISCDQYHVHDAECFPWERWTTDKGVIYRGMVGKLLTMWVRIEEIIGHEPVASDPATVPAPAPAPCFGLSSINPHPKGSRVDDCPECVDGPLVRPFISQHFAAAADAGALGIARVDGELMEPTRAPAAVGRANADQCIALGHAPDACRVGHPEPHPLTELVDAPAAVPVIPGDTAEAALRRWVGTSIEAELLRGGPFTRRTDALAAVRSHPAAEMVDEETALAIAEVLVRDGRPRRSWWTLSSILGGAQ